MIFTLFVLAWLLIGVFSMLVGGKIYATVEDEEEELRRDDIVFWVGLGPCSLFIIFGMIIHSIWKKSNRVIFTLKPFRINKKESK